MIGVVLLSYLMSSPVLYPWPETLIVFVAVLIPDEVVEVNLLVYPEPELPILIELTTLFLLAHFNSWIPTP